MIKCMKFIYALSVAVVTSETESVCSELSKTKSSYEYIIEEFNSQSTKLNENSMPWFSSRPRFRNKMTYFVVRNIKYILIIHRHLEPE